MAEVFAAFPTNEGEYVFRITEMTANAVTRAALPITSGQAVTDTLNEGDDTGENPYTDWIYAGRQGERITVTLEHLSSALDPVLTVGYMEDNEFRQVAFNDDADRLNSRLMLTLRETRDYVIRAGSFDYRTGAYRLRLVAAPIVARAVQTRYIAAGEDVHGTLDDNDAALKLDGSPYEHWTYRATHPNERVVVTLSSEDFDTFLSVGTMLDGSFEEFTRNDDVPGESRTSVSSVTAVLPKPGEYVIRVNTFGPAERGDYVLRLERSAPSP
jgi:hypothetical protein